MRRSTLLTDSEESSTQKSDKKCNLFTKPDCSFLRSEEMVLCEIFIPTDICYSFISNMGEHALVQFLDSNEHIPQHRREYCKQIIICDELEKQVLYLSKKLKEFKIPVPRQSENPPVPHERDLSELKNRNRADFSLLRKLTDEVKEVDDNTEKLKKNLETNKEFKQVLVRILKLNGNIRQTTFARRHPLEGLESEVSDGFSTKVYGGIIQRDKMLSMETMLMRCCHGNYILHIDELTEPISDEHDTFRKCVFVVFFQGDKTEGKVIAVAKAYKAKIYKAEYSNMKCLVLLKECSDYISNAEKVLSTTLAHLKIVLKSAAPNICRWYIQLMQMKAIYHTLNLINNEKSEKFMIAKCWVPKKNLPKINDIMKASSEGNDSEGSTIINHIETTDEPPTCITLNKFTVAFQNIIHAYGVANYQEINPMPFTVITFPFLFAIMFGDGGHGAIMTIFAIIMVTCEEKLEKKNINSEMWQIIFSGRYIILMMGLFSIYTGSIYNDCFGQGIKVMHSRWTVNYDKSTVAGNELLQLNPEKDYGGTPFVYGMDPVWTIAENNIDFLNSFKMKLSIILGITQMYFGIILSLLNHIFFKNYISIIGEFIPQLIFFTCLFGYLMFLCFFKWITFGPNIGMKRGPACAPSIIITFINMVLRKESEVPKGCDKEIYTNQAIVELLLMITALICIPWMLFTKPVAQWLRHKKVKGSNVDEKTEADLELQYTMKFHTSLKRYMKEPDHVRPGEENEGILSFFIHQCIHTIEFVLGSVSYTASYLRLWALSLAHSQLSGVLWAAFLTGFQKEIGAFSFVLLFVVFQLWAFLTVAILVLMEGLSAFLHALRLHWMEFQSKFYTGGGYPYEPFTFAHIKKSVDLKQN